MLETQRTGVDVVQRVGNARQPLKEFVGVDVLRVWTDAVHLCINVDRWVHSSHGRRGRRRLRLLYTLFKKIQRY